MKLIIDVEKEYYEMLKYYVEHGDKYKPIEIIANGIPYEERPQDCFGCKRFDFPYFEVKFDKELMQELVDKAKENVLARIVRGKWFPIKTRPMNDEEKKKANEYFGIPYEDLNWPDAWHYDCRLPEVKDDECVDVLVTTKEGYVVVTSYSKDCFGSASFENVEYPDDITAWAYMPEPYEKEGESDADS